MGDGELAAIAREVERAICSNNRMCRRNMDAKLTGEWFLQMDAIQKSTNAAYSFRLLSFAATLRELEYFSPKRANLENRAAHIYTTLYVIKNLGMMAFETRLGLSASKLIKARREKKKFDYFLFSLKKFGIGGGKHYSFSLAMSDVLIGDVQKNIESDNVFITFGKATMDINYNSTDETVELDRTIRG